MGGIHARGIVRMAGRLVLLWALCAAPCAFCEAVPDTKAGEAAPAAASSPSAAAPQADAAGKTAGDSDDAGKHGHRELKEPPPAFTYDFARHNASRDGREVDHRVLATSGWFGLLLEHGQLLRPADKSAVQMNSVAVTVGGPVDDTLVAVHFGLGATIVRGSAQNEHPTSLFMHFKPHITGNLSGEIYGSLPLNDFFGGNPNNNPNGPVTTGAFQFEAALRWDWEHASLKFGYRFVSIKSTTWGGWFAGFGLNF